MMSDPTTPRVCIITLNYNQNKYTFDCVTSILNSDYSNYHLLLIDNGSDLQNYCELRKSLINTTNVELIRIEHNVGYVGGINYGLEISEKKDVDFFLIMNNDTLIDKTAISELVRCAEKFDRKAIVSGKVFYHDKPDTFQYIGSVFVNKFLLKEKCIGRDEKDNGQYDVDEERDMLDDIYWLLPRNIIDKIGMYSTHFFLYGEQADLALRAMKNGFKLIYAHKAKLWHKGSLTTGNGNRTAPAVNYWRKKSLVIYYFKNTSVVAFLYIMIIDFFLLFSKYFLTKTKIKKTQNPLSYYAEVIGYLHGIKWLFTKKENDGYNPFIN